MMEDYYNELYEGLYLVHGSGAEAIRDMTGLTDTQGILGHISQSRRLGRYPAFKYIKLLEDFVSVDTYKKVIIEQLWRREDTRNDDEIMNEVERLGLKPKRKKTYMAWIARDLKMREQGELDVFA